MTDRIEALARECAEEWYPGTPDRQAEMAAMVARRVRAYLRPEGAVPVRVCVAWMADDSHDGIIPIILDGAARKRPSWFRADYVTAYLVPPQPEAGDEAEGVTDG